MEVQLWGSTAPEVTATGTSSAGASTATALGERKIKMNGVLDQGDDSEFTLDDTKDTVKAHERYVNLMGGPPTPEQEPTAEQLSAMRRRVETLQLSPYADFAVWVQFAKKKLKALKLKTWTMQQERQLRCEGPAGTSRPHPSNDCPRKTKGDGPAVLQGSAHSRCG